MPLKSMMQKRQFFLQIMSNIKSNCTSKMFSQIMSCFCRLAQVLEDVRVCRHTKLEHVSSCTTKTATCHWVQSTRAKSHLGQHISPRSPLQGSARSWTSSSQDDSCNQQLGTYEEAKPSTVGVAQHAWIDFIEPKRVPPGHSRHNHTDLL